MSRAHRCVMLALVVAALAAPARACLWDSDTLAHEARGIQDVIAVITGRFERNPPLYYEMRLKRVSELMARDPSNLEAYDDAAVSCDRLGRGDEAIAWMERKCALLDKLPAEDARTREHRYRYLANLGTVVVHRWFRNGADRGTLDEVRRARGLIAAAIKLNPTAHFGREKYQLMALEYVLAPPPAESPGGMKHFPDFRRYDPASPDTLRGADPSAVQGIAGLVALGGAWESVDTFYALAVALRSRPIPSYFAELRCYELIDSGRKSLVPGAPEREDLKYSLHFFPPLHGNRQRSLKAKYVELRNEADAWHARRTAYMMARLRAGRHPDTDPTFWRDWHDPGPPSLQVSPWEDVPWVGLGVTAWLALALFAIICQRRRRARLSAS